MKNLRIIILLSVLIPFVLLSQTTKTENPSTKTKFLSANFIISVLPLIEVVDETEQMNFQWWRHPQTSEKKELAEFLDEVYTNLSQEFFKFGLNFINPIQRKDFEVLPNSLRMDSHTDEDLIYLSNYLDLQIILQGSIKITKTETSQKIASLHLNVLNPKTKKIILSLDKKVHDTSSWYERKNIYDFVQEEMDSSAMDLASQIFDNWQRGTLTSQTFTIEINGQFNLEEQGKLKQKLASKLPEIKSLKERSLSLKSVVFEAETHLTSDLLSEKILSIKELKLRKDMTVKDQTRLIFQKEAQ